MAEWEAGTSSRRGSTSRWAEEDDDDTVYVAVGKDFEENKLNLVWAIENFPGKRLCILHVHQPAKMIHLGINNFLSMCYLLLHAGKGLVLSIFFHEQRT